MPLEYRPFALRAAPPHATATARHRMAVAGTMAGPGLPPRHAARVGRPSPRQVMNGSCNVTNQRGRSRPIQCVSRLRTVGQRCGACQGKITLRHVPRRTSASMPLAHRPGGGRTPLSGCGTSYGRHQGCHRTYPSVCPLCAVRLPSFKGIIGAWPHAFSGIALSGRTNDSRAPFPVRPMSFGGSPFVTVDRKFLNRAGHLPYRGSSLCAATTAKPRFRFSPTARGSCDYRSVPTQRPLEI